VEHSFRIAKSDLRTRPIYHFKKEPIQAHVLICFTALAIAKYMELKTGRSTKKIVNQLRAVTDTTILNTLTRETTVMRSIMPDETNEIVEKLGLN